MMNKILNSNNYQTLFFPCKCGKKCLRLYENKKLYCVSCGWIWEINMAEIIKQKIELEKEYLLKEQNK